MSGAPTTDEERMVVAAARELRDGEACFVGIGVPSLVAGLAKRTHARRLTLVYESGAIDCVPPVPPLSTGSPSVAADAAMLGRCLDVFSALQAGRLDVGLLSAAQIDRRGNLNSTVIGEYRAPKVRLVGSGGAHDIASLIQRVVVTMPHDPRRFVEAVDFVTSPGPALGSPWVVVTPRARFVFVDGDLALQALQAGFSVEDAIEGFPWKPVGLEDVEELPAPDAATLEVLRTEVLPRREPKLSLADSDEVGP